MCGIVGYVGKKKLSKVLYTGLQRLEYRGYDSGGIATVHQGQLNTRRAVGKVHELGKKLKKEPLDGTIGIAHTRWATHGEPSETNAHPHVDANKKIAIVHNGIIENYSTIRTFLEKQGITFKSETDTESLVQLIGYFYQKSNDLISSVRKSLNEVEGTYGIALVCVDCPDVLIAARKGSPLLVGIGNDEFLVSSDGSAIIEHTDRVVYLNDGEIVTLDLEKGMNVTTIDEVEVEKEVAILEMTFEQIQLEGYDTYMLKEIYEQPISVKNTIRGRLNNKDNSICLGGLGNIQDKLEACQRLLIIGCGTAWHAGMIGEYLLEDFARVQTEVEYASELRYRNPIVEKNTVAIAISQSGETADTLAALREIQLKGGSVLGVVNTVGSTIARETDAGVYLHAGPEIGVASTKAFTSQVAVLTMLAIDIGRRRSLAASDTCKIIEELSRIPEKIAGALELDSAIKELAKKLVDRDNWLYLGRGVNYPVALEGALKLKEISYIHAEGMPAAEIKHGPIALIDDGMPVVVIAPYDQMYKKTISNIEEVLGRHGRVIAIASEGDTQLEKLADEVLYVPKTIDMLSPLITTIPLQLLAYHTAVLRGQDVDKPRNLAKSVTVE